MNKFLNIKLFASILFLLFLCFFFSQSSLAKYCTAIYNLKKYYTVAHWDVSANIPNTTLNIEPLGEYEYTITVTNNSDVAVYYDIYFSNIPNGINISIDDSKYSDGKNIWYAKNVGVIDTSNENKINKHIIKIKVSNNVIESINETIDIQVIINQKMP